MKRFGASLAHSNAVCRVGLLGFSVLLAACGSGFFQVRINGEVKNLGGEEPKSGAPGEEGSGSAEGTSSGGSSNGGKGESKADEELRLATKQLIQELDAALREKPAALPSAKLDELESKLGKFEQRKLGDDAAYLRHLIRYYRLENAWRGETPNVGDALAKLLDSSVTASGEVSGKEKQTFKFKAEAGKCYVVLSHLKSAGGDDDRLTSFFLDAGKDAPTLQRYSVSYRTTRGAGQHAALSKSYTYGACATKTVDVTANVELAYAGTTNGLRYVVLEHAREKLPHYLMLDMEPAPSDSCDVEGWTQLWTNPIPASVLYGSESPFIPYDVGTSEEMWMTAWTPGMGEARAKREDLTSTPPGQLKFGKQLSFKGCPKDLKYAHSPDGIKVAQCWTNLDKKFDPQYAAAEKARSNAVGILAQIAADRRMQQLNNQYDAEADRTCRKLDADVGRRMEAAYNKIVDFYQATPYKSPWDRGAALKSTWDGVSNIMCAGAGTYCSL